MFKYLATRIAPYLQPCRFDPEVQRGEMREFLAKFRLTHECYVCKKQVVAGWDKKYSDWKGRVFCSHECIDTNTDSG